MLASQREYAHKMDAVSVAMDKLRLPAQLRARVEQYYAYLWSRHGTFDIRHQLADELSSCLRSEMNIFFHRRLIAKAPLFCSHLLFTPPVPTFYSHILFIPSVQTFCSHLPSPRRPSSIHTFSSHVVFTPSIHRRPSSPSARRR